VSELTVDTDAMRSHATALSDVVQGLAEAADAAASTSLPDTSFGLLCSFLVPPALLVQGGAAAGVVAGSAAVGGTQVAIRGSAAAYDGVDSAVQGAMKLIEEALP
jgi:hypothetical protein